MSQTLSQSRKKEQLRIAQGVFVDELRGSYTPEEGEGLLDGVPLTKQPPLLLGSHPELSDQLRRRDRAILKGKVDVIRSLKIYNCGTH